MGYFIYLLFKYEQSETILEFSLCIHFEWKVFLFLCLRLWFGFNSLPLSLSNSFMVWNCLHLLPLVLQSRVRSSNGILGLLLLLGGILT